MSADPATPVVTIEPRITRTASAAARRTVREHVGYCAAAALIPGSFVSSAAVAGMHLNMLAALSRIYGVPFRQEPVKAALAAGSAGVLQLLLSSNPVTRVAREFFTATMPWLALPVRLLGPPVIMAGYSYFLGQAFIRHYENGGNYLDFDWWAFRAELLRKLGLPPLASRPIDV